MKQRKKTGHAAADALDWDEAMALIRSLFRDGRVRDSLLVCCGCFLGLRISDILSLRWKDLCGRDTLTLEEKKTGKSRQMKINARLREHALLCRRTLNSPGDDEYVFCGRMYGGLTPMTRQRADQILKEAGRRYGIRSAKTFSTHSLRKTFGRRVYLQECRRGRGEQALLLLQEVFGHASVRTTKRYLGIRQEEILSVYDSLSLSI